MINRSMRIKIWLIALQILCFFNIFVAASLNCSDVNGNNFEQLSGTWESHFAHENGTLKYKLNLCAGLQRQDTCNGSSICRESDTFPLASLGSFQSTPTVTQNNQVNVNRRSFRVEYEGGVCKTMKESNGSNINVNYRTSITFDCAKTLGVPQIVAADECFVHFEWNSNVVCKSADYDPVKEVKCYQFDTIGEMIDLNRLIKLTGGYLAENGETSDEKKLEIYFNVCRDINMQNSHDTLKHHLPTTSVCPQGTAACLIKEGKSYSLGRPQEGLKINGFDSLSIVYRPDASDERMPDNCDANSTEVTINFICPLRGSNHKPIVSGAEDCKYQVEWWTEAACQDKVLSKTNECKLEMETHGVNIDLSSLRNQSGSYEVPGLGSEIFKLNICGPTNSKCGAHQDLTHNAVCQYNTVNNPDGYIAGLADDYKLEYFDELLFLTYSHGEICPSNGFGRTSIIKFICDETAGDGRPVFTSEDHCTYLFDWKTSHACTLNDDQICGLYDSNDDLIDLSDLTRTDGNWEVSDVMDKGVNRSTIFMNLCQPVIRKKASIACAKDAAICKVSLGEKPVSFGNFLKSNITTNKDGDITVLYEGGDSCGIKQRSTKIHLFCAPEVTTEEPRIHYESSDGCTLSIIWYSASACAEYKFQGSQCMVVDSVTGHTFDLRPLIATDKMYEISTYAHNYTLNVCDGLKGKRCGAGSSSDVAVCQSENHGQQRDFVIGKKSDNLTYFDRDLQLLYDDGDMYGDGINHRKTQINFICDKSAGKGQPSSVKEEDHTYWIEWKTSYACPPTNEECSITDPTTSDHYDFHELSRSAGNWIALGDRIGNDKQRKYYLNICKSVNFVNLGNEKIIDDIRNCSVDAGMCETVIGGGTEHVTHPNGGRVGNHTLTVTSKGHVLLTYTNGDSDCDEGEKRTTNIHLICDQNEHNSKPRYTSTSSDGCMTDFTWFTEHACPVHITNSTDIKQCQIHIADHVVDLKSLTRDVNDVYVVNNTDGSTYEMNICGGVHSCGDNNTIHACKRDNNGHVGEKLPTLTSIKHTLDDNIEMKYTSTEKYADGKLSAYVITFICDRGVTSHEVITQEQVGDDVTERRFVMRTSVVCPPQQFTCDDVTDKFGGEYDLRSISGKDVEVYNSVVPNISFHLHLCGDVQEQHCPSGSQVCMIDDQTSKGFGLGVLQAAPRAQANTIVMSYRNGEVCQNDPTRRYSATVTLVCGMRAGVAPVILPTDDPCHYDIEWSTTSACAVDLTRGSGCVVTDPLHGMTFDLSSLKSTTPYEIKTGGEYNYKLNICDQIHCTDCGACGEDAAICQISPTGTESSLLGKPNDQLIYDDGELYLKYNQGNKCGSNGETISSKIRFICSHKENEASFVEKSSDSCNYLFKYPTPLACPPMVSTMCSASDINGEVFDLSILQSATDDGVLVDTIGDTDGKLFYINICRSLVPHHGLACSPTSAACIKVEHNNKTTSYISAGRIGEPPTYTDDGHLKLMYPNGDSCPYEGGHKNYSTTITFLCADATYTPLLVSNPNTCDIQISWRTSAVCPTSNQITNGDNCTAINPITDKKYDLTSLSRANLTADSLNTAEKFNLNICKPATGCPSGAGACEASTSLSYGKASSNLIYSDGSLSLHYSNGDKCPTDANRNLSTTISFVCHRSTSLLMEAPDVEEQPIVIDTSNCEANIVWRTFEACELQHACSVADEHNLHVIDLTPLVQEKGHYITYKNSNVNYNKAVYFLSICRPLDAMPGVNCPPGAAVCEVQGQSHQPQSRGHIDPRTPMITYEDGKVNLRYESSEKCATNPSVNISSRIIFTCDHEEGWGEPLFTEVTSDCVHTFDWTTNVTCTQSKSVVENKRCTYNSDVSDYVHDLSSYPSTTYENDVGKLELNPCDGSVESSSGADDPCYNAAACLTSDDGQRYSLGARGTHTYQRVPSDLKSFQAKYIHGSDCPTTDGVRKQRSLVVYYQCTLNVEATPYFQTGNDCEYLFYWPSPQFCAPTTESCEVYDVHNEEIYDFSPLSSHTNSWEVTDHNDNRFWINLCRASQESDTSNKCPADSAVCLKQKDGTYHSFGKLSTQTMTVESADHVIIRYSRGDHSLSSICDDGRINASTIITMKCDPKISNPIIFDRLDASTCILHVTWKTQQACHRGGYRTATIDDEWRITDPITNILTDLSPVIDQTVVAEGDMREEDGPVRYNYLINLSGNPDGQVLEESIPGHEEICKDAVVCQFKPGKSFTRKVATISQSPLYIVDDGTVEIQFTSDDKCGRKPANNSYALIRLKCSHNDDIGVPVFMHESDDCGYFFTWDTKAACSIEGNGKIHADDTTSVSSGLSGGSIFLILLISFIIVGFTVVMIKKPEARHTIINTCQPCCRRNNNPRYRYLRGETSDDDDASLLGDDDLLMEGAPLVNRRTNDTNFGGITTTSISRGRNNAADEEDIFSLPDVKVYSGDAPTEGGKSGKQPPPINQFADNDIDEFLMELDSPRTSYGEDTRRTYQS